MPLSNEEQMDIIKQATMEGYQGSFTDLFNQADPEFNMQIPEGPSIDQSPVQHQGMSPGAPQPILESQVPTSQSLVQSYESAPPGESPLGESVSSVVHEPSEYKRGGYKVSTMLGIEDKTPDPNSYINSYTDNYIDVQTGAIKRYRTGGVLDEIGKRDIEEGKHSIHRGRGKHTNKDPLKFLQKYHTSERHANMMEESGYRPYQIKNRTRYIDYKGGPEINYIEGSQTSHAKPYKNIVNINPSADKKIFGSAIYNPKEVEAHEISHLSLRENLNDNDKQEILERNYKVKEKGQLAFKDMTLAAQEVKADLDGLRYLLYTEGIHDASKEEFSKADLERAKRKLWNKSITLRRLLHQYSDEDLEWLLNNIAMDSPDPDSEEEETRDVRA